MIKQLIQTLGKWGALATSIVAIGGALSGLWFILDYLQVRPVLIREVKVDEEVVAQNFKVVQLSLEQTSQSVLWLQYDNLKNKLSVTTLTPKEQHDLCAVTKQLGVPPLIQGCPQ